MISGILRNIAAYARGARLQEGDRVRVLQEIRATGLAYYHAPATTGFRCRLPVGAVLRVYAEPSRLGFACTVDDPEIESQLVPATTLNDEKYAGVAFRFGYGELGRRLTLITE